MRTIWYSPLRRYIHPLPLRRRAGFNSRAMAKKKTTKTTKSAKTPKPTTTKKLSKSTATHAPKKATAKTVDTAGERLLETDNVPTVEAGPTPAREPGAMSHIEIGHVAGELWGALSRNGGLTVASLKKEVAAPGDVVMAAIGWLAREDKLAFDTAGRVVKVSLR
jgi:hypothetical protein